MRHNLCPEKWHTHYIKNYAHLASKMCSRLKELRESIFSQPNCANVWPFSICSSLLVWKHQDCHDKINNAPGPGKATWGWVTVWKPFSLGKKTESGTRRAHNVLSSSHESRFSFSCFPAAQKIDPMVTEIWLFHRSEGGVSGAYQQGHFTWLCS